MTDLEALRAAIAANWDEDTPRLVYADALDESGSAVNALRARFIRLSIARRYEAPEEAQSAEGKGRKHEYDWLAQSLAARLNWPTGNYTWDRGFLLAVSCKSAEWELNGHNLAASEAPPLRFGVFLDKPFAPFVFSPHILNASPEPIGTGERFEVITRQWDPSFAAPTELIECHGKFNNRPFHTFPKGSLQLISIAAQWEVGMRPTERRWRYTFAYHRHSPNPIAAALGNMNRAHVYGVCNMADAIRGEILTPFPEPDAIRAARDGTDSMFAAAYEAGRQSAVAANRHFLESLNLPRTGFITRPHT